MESIRENDSCNQPENSKAGTGPAKSSYTPGSTAQNEVEEETEECESILGQAPTDVLHEEPQ